MTHTGFQFIWNSEQKWNLWGFNSVENNSSYGKKSVVLNAEILTSKPWKYIPNVSSTGSGSDL